MIYYLFHSNQTQCHDTPTCVSWYLMRSIERSFWCDCVPVRLSTSMAALPGAESLLPDESRRPGPGTGSSSAFKGRVQLHYCKTWNRSCSRECLMVTCSDLCLLDWTHTPTCVSLLLQNIRQNLTDTKTSAKLKKVHTHLCWNKTGEY